MCYVDPKKAAAQAAQAAASGAGASPRTSPRLAAKQGQGQQQQQQQQEEEDRYEHNTTIIDRARKTTDAYDEDVKPTDTPAWILRVSPYIDNFNWAVNPFMYMLIPLCFAYQLWAWDWFTWQEMGWAYVHSYWRFIMGWGIHHRFFSHQAYACSRLTTALLGLFSCAVAQRGPLWWSSKHIRHHKYCENSGEYPYTDPHSIHRIQNFFYCYMGWTLHPYEKRVDWDFVLPQYKVWEMVLVEACTWMVPMVECALRYKYFGIHSVLLHIYWTGFWLFITLHLNMAGHDDGTPEQAPVNGRYKCNAVSIKPWYLRYTIDLIAELDHVDHHLYPRKAKRDSYMGLDVFYWTILWPGEKLGIFWEVRDDAKGRISRKAGKAY